MTSGRHRQHSLFRRNGSIASSRIVRAAASAAFGISVLVTVLGVDVLDAGMSGSSWYLGTTTPAAAATGELPLPATNASGKAPAANPDVNVEQMSCTSEEFCVAVGYYTDANSRQWAFIDTEASGTWSSISAPEPSTNPAGYGPGNDSTSISSSALYSVSCPATGACVAVGSYLDSTSGGNAWVLIDTLSGGTWTASTLSGPSTNADGYTGRNGRERLLVGTAEHDDVHVDDVLCRRREVLGHSGAVLGVDRHLLVRSLDRARQHLCLRPTRRERGLKQTQAPVRPVISLRCRVLRRVRARRSEATPTRTHVRGA